MRPSRETSLLTRHFLRRLFDNDLISPHIDLHENVTVIIAAIVSTTLFLCVLLASKSLFGVPTPGPTAILALGDNFFFIAFSMLVMALAAAMQWDALSLDERDTLNLGVLPIARRTMIQAKITALAFFATGLALALNLLPSTVYQSLLVAKIPVGLTGLIRLSAAHAIASTSASAFGFIAVVAFRELLRAVVGARLFSRVSRPLQAVLVLLLISGLLLLPRSNVISSRVWLGRGLPAPGVLAPLWFLGLGETLGGGVVAYMPHLKIPARLAAQNTRAIAMYRASETIFADMARTALVGLLAVTAIGVAAYAWNVRRLPQPAPSIRRCGAGLRFISGGFAAWDRVARAGFTFAIQVILRSPAHRLSIATAAAVALALSLMLIGRVGFAQGFDPSLPPHSLLAVQTVLLLVLLGGFRRAVRIPAELRANWAMQMAWRRSEHRFLSGVRRAGIAMVVLPTVFALVPLHFWLFDAPTALAHAAVGLLFGIVLVYALFAGYRNAAFASPYIPAGNIKTLGPIVFVAFVYFVWIFARVERVALTNASGLNWLAAALGVAFLLVRLADVWLRRGRPAMRFEEPPEPATEWLGLTS